VWVSALSPKVRKNCSAAANAGCVYNPCWLAELVPRAYYTSTENSGFRKAVTGSVAPLMPSSFNGADEMSVVGVDAVLSLSLVLSGDSYKEPAYVTVLVENDRKRSVCLFASFGPSCKV
jgi:hypothetical protein